MKKLWTNYSYAFIFILATMISTIFMAITKEQPLDDNYQSITIAEGETLWDLAEQYESEHEMSTVDFITWVEEANNINGNEIVAGETLFIPVKMNEDKVTELASN